MPPFLKSFERILFCLVLISSFFWELALIDRKYAIFSGGFGQPNALRHPFEILLFLAGTFGAHVLFLAVLANILSRLLPRRDQRPYRVFNLTYLGAGISLAILNARLELLSYFSDAISFELIQKLGGGSIITALLYVLSEGTAPFAIFLAALSGYGLGIFILHRVPIAPAFQGPPLRFPRVWLGTLAAGLSGLCLAINLHLDVRQAAGRMTAFSAFHSILHYATDFDRDGYSLFSAQIDRQPFDAKRHPYALDIPDNGIDEDELGGDYHPTISFPQRAMPPLPAKKRHLVLVLLETTRFDAIGRVIDGKPVTPNLDRLAQTGSSVAAAYSHAGFTTPSVTALFSGRLDPLEGQPTLFHDLKRAGYRIASFSGGDEDFGGMARITGARATAGIFVDARSLKDERALTFASKGSLLVDEASLFREFDRELRNPADWKTPHFVYFFFKSSHFPYSHSGMRNLIVHKALARSEIAPHRRKDLMRTYYNSVAYADMRVGQLIQRLKALGVWNNTLMVVTADHGESLFDDDFLGHGHMINSKQLHIPMIFNQPGIHFNQPVGLEDLRWIIGDLLANKQPTTLYPTTFLYIGDLDRPSSIGTFDWKGTLTRFNLSTRTLFLSEGGERLIYDALAPDSPARQRADALIAEWERRRWEAHLARQNGLKRGPEVLASPATGSAARPPK